jgi:hypothetical protein
MNFLEYLLGRAIGKWFKDPHVTGGGFSALQQSRAIAKAKEKRERKAALRLEAWANGGWNGPVWVAGMRVY